MANICAQHFSDVLQDIEFVASKEEQIEGRHKNPSPPPGGMGIPIQKGPESVIGHFEKNPKSLL